MHDARMHSDMLRMFINHHTFAFDAVFGEAASNQAVYQETAAPLVGRAVNDGVTATIMMYGQTGSGKTYTMSAIYEMVSRDLFGAITAASPGQRPGVSVSFVELAGDRCHDMLNRGKQVQLLTGRDGAVHPYPVAEITVNSADELLCFIRMACSLRATQATGVHDHSSRSHAVCRIFVHQQDDSDGHVEGMLQLVDLAGSEHRIDSAEHDAARRKEGAQINSSLAALKECVRCKAKRGGGFVPYRKSKLTHLLRACFEDTNPTVVIATVSPSSKDTEHSLNTIRHACIMDGQGTGALDPAPSCARGAVPQTIATASHVKCITTASHVTGGQVVRQHVGELDVTALARQRRAEKLADKGSGGGEGPGKWGEVPRAPQEEESITPAEAQRRRLQALRQAERRALKDLDSARLLQLEGARSVIGDDARQSRRLQRWGAAGPPLEVDDCGWQAGAGAFVGATGGVQGLHDTRSLSAEGPRSPGEPDELPPASCMGEQDLLLSPGIPGNASAARAPRIPSAGRRKPSASAGQEGGPVGAGPRETGIAREGEKNVAAGGGVEAAATLLGATAAERAAEVARRRERVERQKKEALQHKLEAKENKRERGALAVLTCHQNGAGTGHAGLRELEQEEARLEREMMDIAAEMKVPNLSAAKLFALKKSLAVCRAELLRLNRKSKAAVIRALSTLCSVAACTHTLVLRVRTSCCDLYLSYM